MKRKKTASRRDGSILSIDSYSLMGDPDAQVRRSLHDLSFCHANLLKMALRAIGGFARIDSRVAMSEP